MNSDIRLSILLSSFFLFFFSSSSPLLLAHCHWLFIAIDRMSKSPPICFEEKNGSLAFGAPAPLTKIFYFILFLFFYYMLLPNF
jgi:hypothetical protein